MPEEYPHIDPVPDPPAHHNRGLTEESSQTTDLATTDPAAGDDAN